MFRSTRILKPSSVVKRIYFLNLYGSTAYGPQDKGLKVMGYSSYPKRKNNPIIFPEEKKIILPEEKKLILHNPPLHLSQPPPLRQILTESCLGVYKEVRSIEEEENIARIAPYNWAEAGAITPHRYQGFFQTCWAFAPSVAASANHFIHSGILLELSVQFVVDKTESRGKEGNYPETWFEKVKEFGGCPLWDTYPYVLPNYPKGWENAPLVQFGLKWYHRLNPTHILELLKTGSRQPIIVSFPISVEFLQYQDGEIISTYTFPPNPKNQGLHETVIVAYQITPAGQRYFVHKDTMNETVEFVNIAIELEIYITAMVPTYDKKKSVFLSQETQRDASQQQAGDGEKKMNKRKKRLMENEKLKRFVYDELEEKRSHDGD